jgi:hypothetical protein
MEHPLENGMVKMALPEVDFEMFQSSHLELEPLKVLEIVASQVEHEVLQ